MSTPDFEDIYERHFSDVYKYVRSLCYNETLAEEITQETFFKAMRHIDRFDGRCKLYVWLCQIAKNTYFSHHAKRKYTVPEMDAECAETAFDLESAYLEKEDAKRLHRLLHNLDEPYKEVFTLRVFGELPFSQIGELFRKSDSWARLVFYRAKKQLQEAMR